MKKGKLLIPNEDRCTITICNIDEDIVLPSAKKVKTDRHEKDTFTDNEILKESCIHHFKTDLINNMDYMRISDNEPSSVILSQTKLLQSWNDCPKVSKPSWSQKGWCNKPTKLQFLSILILKILMFSNATNQPKSPVELSYMCPRGLTDPPAVTLTK